MNEFLKNIALEGDDLPVLVGLREKGRLSFERQKLPTAKTESWKYTRVHDLEADDFITPPHSDHHCSCHDHSCDHKSCTCHETQSVLPFDAYEIVFCNGRLAHDHFHLPDGIEVMSLLDAVYDHETADFLNKSFDMDSFPFGALNTACLEQGIFLRIRKDFSPDKPIALIYRTDGKTKYASNIRNLIVLENHASANLVEYAFSTGEPKSAYFHNIVNEIFIGKNAVLRHNKFQNEAFKAVHIALQSVRVKESGHYESFCLQKGANLARNETHVALCGTQARATVDSAYVMNGWATIDTTTDIEHLVPETTSNQLIKGVIGGQAKGVFQGKIHIAPNAVKTEGYQLHRALLLTDDAEVDVKPELEIYADDVKCSHGATCGDLDKEQLFYLRTRGLGEEEAKRLLIDAFVQEVIDHVATLPIREWLKER